ncbi:MAG: right-handed parallel beta-helix repeat-containing protein [Clostridia bacterium]|nr:right-handed parallel beta-helix repeat-containing protein [Clostridia bacterium]
MILKRISAFAMAVIAVIGMNTVSYAEIQTPTALYVSLDGNDSAQGTIDAPLRTVERARDILRSRSGDEQKIVYIRGGEYTITSSIILEEQDSGVTYKSYPGEKVTFIGGVEFDDSAVKKVADSGVLSKVADQAAREHIVEVDLAQFGITELPEQLMRGAYSYTWAMRQIHKRQKGAAAPELIVNGNMMELARYPNDGTITISKVIEHGDTPRYWNADMETTDDYIPEEERTGDPFVIEVLDDRVKYWTTANYALMHGYWMKEWADQTVPLAKVDADKKWIYSKYPSEYNVDAGTGRVFYIYNLLEEIDLPGEYYIDNDSKKLYFYPLEGAETISGILSLIDVPVFVLENAHDITINGINITATRSNAVTMTGGYNNTLLNSEISFTASRAVQINEEKNSGVRNCYIHDVDGGVGISGGNFETLEGAGLYVENCKFERYSRLTHTYNPAIHMLGVGNRACHNEISDGEHTALQWAGNNQTIAFNEIYNVCYDVGDMGAIYCGRNLTSRGNRIIYNYVHDIQQKDGEGKQGVHGVYLDDFFSSATVAGNVFENVSGYGVKFGGRDNIIYNNVFVNVGTSAIWSGDDGNTTKFGTWASILATLDTVPYRSEIWKEAYPELYTILDDGKPGYSKGNVVSNNVVVNSGAMDIHINIITTGKSEDNYVVGGDPGFYDMENRNYLVKEDSEVYKRIPDFKPIPFTRMGRVEERATNRVAQAVCLCIGSPNAKVAGKDVLIDEENRSVVPVIADDYTLVPIRFIAEALGAEVSWADGTVSIIGENNTVSFKIGETAATLNGADVELTTAAQIIGERTFVPLRSVSELLQKEVFWDEKGLIVISGYEELLKQPNDEELITYLYDSLVCL